MKKSTTSQLSYLEAQEALERIIAELQSEDLPIEEIPSLYAKAMELENRCRAVLEQVVQDIKKIDPHGFTISELTTDQP
jgi:exodeoxyribonuclease VII small subunit